MALLGFIERRATPKAEAVRGETYQRAVCIGARTGLLRADMLASTLGIVA